MSGPDWVQWHEAYADAGSGLSGRLAVVREHVSRRLDETAPGPVRVTSACAGDGRDLLGVLEQRPDRDRVTAVLVELDPRLAGRAREAATAVGAQVEVRQADAGVSDSYAGVEPADLLLLCGIFGNVTDADVRGTIAAAPELCAPGAEVIWTRHREEPDLTGDIRRWFEDTGFTEVAFESPGAGGWAVGVHRLAAVPRPLAPGRRWFAFVR